MTKQSNSFSNFQEGRSVSRIVFGAGLVVVAILALAAPYIDIDFNLIAPWLISWPMLLVVIGLIRLIEKRRFELWGALALVVGGKYLIDRIDPLFLPDWSTWPFVLLIIGLHLLFNPSGSSFKGNRKRWDKPAEDLGTANFNAQAQNGEQGSTNSDAANGFTSATDRPKIEYTNAQYVTTERLTANVAFGGVVRKVVATNFTGGAINCALGGVEVDLLETDIEGTVTLDLSVLMGGVELSVPRHWIIRNEVTPFLGGVEDARRHLTPPTDGPAKILVLTGTVIMGGVEIRN